MENYSSTSSISDYQTQQSAWPDLNRTLSFRQASLRPADSAPAYINENVIIPNISFTHPRRAGGENYGLCTPLAVSP